MHMVMHYQRKDHGRMILVILGNIMDAGVSDSRMMNLFMGSSHSRNINVIFMIQSIFLLGKVARIEALSAYFLVIFQIPDDKP